MTLSVGSCRARLMVVIPEHSPGILSICRTLLQSRAKRSISPYLQGRAYSQKRLSTLSTSHGGQNKRQDQSETFELRRGKGFNPPLDTSTFKISDQVREALKYGWPVVALETTIYTHGFPYPDNVELANSLEDIVRENGAVPATIGIVDGIARVGLSRNEISDLCSRAGDPDTMKVSRRDLPYIAGMGLAGRKICGGTTVSGTMFIAAMAGIRVFGTGGLGGVHRGGQDTMDISADLTELGRTSVAVVSSGCKSFLDIPRTLEYLETQGATVCTFADGRQGQIDFPSFYTRDSGIKSPMIVQSAREAAAMIYSQEIMGGRQTRARNSGLLLANPISEEFSIPKEEIDVAINQAVKEAAEQGFHGHANTPFILARIKDLTQGRSIPVNRALIQGNVKVAAEVAVELANFRNNEKGIDSMDTNTSVASKFNNFQTNDRDSNETINFHTDDRDALGKYMSTTQQSLSALTSQLSNLTEMPHKPLPPSPPDTMFHGKNYPGGGPTSGVAEVPGPDILVLGSVAVDLSCDYSPKKEISKKWRPETDFSIVPKMHTSNIATISQSVGGVGHNVALAAHRAGSSLNVRLHSAVADDLAGNAIINAMKEEGLDISSMRIKQHAPGEPVLRTAQYVAINDKKKDLVLAMADMSIFSNYFFRKTALREADPNLKWAVIDANWDNGFTRRLMKEYKTGATKIAFEPVSVTKAASIFEPTPEQQKEKKKNPLGVFPSHRIDLTTPNVHELSAMYYSARKHEFFQLKDWWTVIDAMGIPSTGARNRFVHLTTKELVDRGIPLQTIQLLPFMPTILTKLGAEGVLLTELLKPGDPRLTNPDSAPWILSRCTNGSEQVGGVYMRLFPAVEEVPDEDILSVNGVGDTFLGVLVAGLAKGAILGESLINIAQKGAVMTLKSKEAVSPKLGELAPELEDLAKITRM